LWVILLLIDFVRFFCLLNMAQGLLDIFDMGHCGWLVGVVLAAAASAQASPGEAFGGGETRAEPVVVIDAPADGKSCGKTSLMCFVAGARDTIAVEAQLVAAPDGKRPAPVTPRFARAASLAARDGHTPKAEGRWTVDFASTLARPAVKGNALFMFFDLDDPESLPNRQITALYQTDVKAGKSMAARLSLEPEDGFRAGHTYRLRVVQLLNGKEVPLVEGDVTLL
jgi:hypothetical protein